jgi:flagellin
MSRINTNISSLIAVRASNQNQASLQQSLQRLATGSRINSASDDPSGLIASQGLKAEQAGTTAAISNAQQADNIIGTADGALGEVSNLLTNLQSLVSSSANTSGLSQSEKDANQLQVDSILSTINRISNSTSFDGTKLLNGNFDYTTSGLATSSAFTSVSINSSSVAGTTVAVTVKVVTSAQTGQLNFLGSTTGLANAATVSITGNAGSVQLAFGSATKSSAIVASINQFTGTTGVQATLSADSKSVKLSSSGYGSNQFVTVTSSNASFSTKDATGNAVNSDYGRNAALTVNGVSATSDGLHVKVVTADFDADFTLNSAINTNGKSKTFGITGGGATFNLGANVTSAGLAQIGIHAVNTASIGSTLDSTGGVHSLADLASGHAASVNYGDTTLAQNIVSQAISDVSSLRARLGAFQSNVIGSTINSLNVASENIASSNSAIADTDFASETANLTRAQILSQASNSVLSQANQNPSSVLKLLG